MIVSPDVVAPTMICRMIVNQVAKVFANVAGMGWTTNVQSLASMSFMFAMFSMFAISITFFVQIVKHNKVSGAEEKINGIKDAAIFLGAKMFLYPLIIAAPALPIATRTITQCFNPWAGSSLVAAQVAGIGDTLLNYIGEIDRVSISAINIDTLNDQDNLLAGLSPGEFKKLSAQRKVAEARVEAAAKKVTSAVPGSTAARAAQQELNVQQQAQLTVEQAVTSSLAKLEAAKQAAAAGYTQDKLKRAVALLQQRSAESFQSEHRDDPAYKDAAQDYMDAYKAVDSHATAIIDKCVSLQRELAKMDSDEKAAAEAAAAAPMGAWDATKFVASSLAELIGSIGYYASIAPALLGIMAGTLSTVKAALGLLQFGAKVSVMVNVGLSIGTIFSSLFMFMILFQKTEQYAFTFLRFLLSTIIACFGIHFVMYTIGMGISHATGGLTAQIGYQIYRMGSLGKHGSMKLFMVSCGVGLTGFAVGMVVDFVVEICKSAGQVAQGVMSGSFNP